MEMMETIIKPIFYLEKGLLIIASIIKYSLWIMVSSIYLALCYQITTEIHEIDTNINHIKMKISEELKKLPKCG